MKQSHCFLLVLLVSGCGADRRLGGETGSGGTSVSGAAGAAEMIGGTTSSSAGGHAASGESNGGTIAASSGGASSGGATVTATGGVSNGGMTSSVFNGGAVSTSMGGSPNGGRTTGGTPSSGTTNGGSSGGSTGGIASAGAHTGGVSNGGASAAGASAGGASGCVPVCPLYGAPCCMWETACLGPTGGCTIDVLAARASSIYQYADLETKVASLPQDISATITDQDIAWVAADPWPAARIEMHLTDDAASRYGSILDSAMDSSIFRVSCAGKPLFVGVFYDVHGAAGLNTPVIHESRENGVLVLRLGAAQGFWYGGPRTDCTTQCQRIDRLELRATFCRGGVMHELDPNARPPS